MGTGEGAQDTPATYLAYLVYLVCSVTRLTHNQLPTPLLHVHITQMHTKGVKQAGLGWSWLMLMSHGLEMVSEPCTDTDLCSQSGSLRQQLFKEQRAQPEAHSFTAQAAPSTLQTNPGYGGDDL